MYELNILNLSLALCFSCCILISFIILLVNLYVFSLYHPNGPCTVLQRSSKLDNLASILISTAISIRHSTQVKTHHTFTVYVMHRLLMHKSPVLFF